MNYDEFKDLIRDLRAAQRSFVQCRTPARLVKVRELERITDRALLVGRPLTPGETVGWPAPQERREDGHDQE